VSCAVRTRAGPPSSPNKKRRKSLVVVSRFLRVARGRDGTSAPSQFRLFSTIHVTTDTPPQKLFSAGLFFLSACFGVLRFFFVKCPRGRERGKRALLINKPFYFSICSFLNTLCKKSTKLPKQKKILNSAKNSGPQRKRQRVGLTLLRVSPL
jgi:hypothetical protein